MPILPQRKTENLLVGRASIPRARYFITLCTENREAGLTETSYAEAILNTWREHHRAGDFKLQCGTIMPDHFHVLFELGERLSLSQVISKFKSTCPSTISWQRNYYDHRLRADDAMEPFSKYIFLNPYRKQLIPLKETWPWWILNRKYRPEFILHLRNARYPHAEWISKSPALNKLIEQDLQQ